ncbi:hypothetical protein IM660_02985 [Ruania alkalisoli]|uniref:DUF2092 domain-containing protein n=1 Tax=Ruania alkalisoli TaxID=2779775 RepID=A0A7M1SWF7_9MICO|nr:hypothetical protein [Ruania alkalisoli]QOR71284.1 hypothetical protein IM660_02985 [Ruania alkalisoli]
MSTSRTLSRRARWAVPAVAAVVVAGALAGPPLLAAADEPALPEATPVELLTSIAEAEPAAHSGTVVHTARLGLPTGGLTEITGADPIGLLDGSSTLRVWTDGAERSRVSLLGSASEYSVVHDGPQAWTYSSTDDVVTHYTLDAAAQARYEDAQEGQTPPGAPELPTPEEAAQQALEHVEEFSSVTVLEQATVAGRDAYQLQITPGTDGTLVEQVRIAVDGETFTPLQVQVWSSSDTSETPALEVGYTDITFATPDDAVLSFSAPAGAEVVEETVSLPSEEASGEASAEHTPPETIGEGWESVLIIDDVDLQGLLAGDPEALADAAASHPMPGSDSGQELMEEFMSDSEGNHGPPSLDTAALYEQLTTEVPEGRVLSTTLLSVLITDDGRLLIGSVPVETLQEMA